VDSDDQLAARSIDSTVTPETAALEAPAPRVEWLVKIEMSMPASDKHDLIHRANVEGDAAE